MSDIADMYIQNINKMNKMTTNELKKYTKRLYRGIFLRDELSISYLPMEAGLFYIANDLLQERRRIES